MKLLKNNYIELLLVIYLAITLSFIEVERKSLACTGISVYIEKEPAHYFVDREEVVQVVKDKSERIEGALLGRINILKIEKAVNLNPSVERADVYRTLNGRLCVRVKQRDPIVRVINNTFEGYYIDTKGAMMPTSNKYTARVPIANGSINEPYKLRYTTDLMKSGNKKDILRDIYVVSLFIRENEFMNALVEQIYVDENKEFVLVPKIGPQEIMLGSAQDVEAKCAKLWIIYNKALPHGRWDMYKRIDLRFKNQVVCTKK